MVVGGHSEFRHILLLLPILMMEHYAWKLSRVLPQSGALGRGLSVQVDDRFTSLVIIWPNLFATGFFDT